MSDSSAPNAPTARRIQPIVWISMPLTVALTAQTSTAPTATSRRLTPIPIMWFSFRLFRLRQTEHFFVSAGKTPKRAWRIRPSQRPSTKREGLAKNRRQHLRCDPDGRCGVAAGVAIAPVGPLERGEIAESSARRPGAGGDEGLDGPGGGLRIRTAAARELEAAVAVLEPAEIGEPASDRPPADAFC